MIWNDPNYRTDFHGLIDMRNANFSGRLSDIKHFIKILIASPKRTNALIAILVSEDRTTGFVMTLAHLVGSLMRIELFQLPENAIRYVGRDVEFFNYLQKSQFHKHVFENRGGVV